MQCRYEVVRRRDGEFVVRMLRELGCVLGRVEQAFGGSFVEALRPVEPGCLLAAVDAAEVVDDVAAAEDEDAPVA